MIASGIAVASQPYGNGNNMYGNGAGLDGHQLWVSTHLPQADWRSNYWGPVLEAVSCPYAPGTVFPWHLSFEQPNPYTATPNEGSVVYQTYSIVQSGHFVYCGADKVMDYPYAAEQLNNFVLRQGQWMSHVPRTTLGGYPQPFFDACLNMDQWSSVLTVTAYLGSFDHDLNSADDPTLAACFSNMRQVGLGLT